MECEVSKQRAVVWWYTVSSQSLGEKWAGWLAGVAGQKRGRRVAAARARPAQSPTQRPQKLPVPRRLDIARAPIHQVGKAEFVAQQPLSPPHVNNWLMSQAVCQTRRRHCLVDL